VGVRREACGVRRKWLPTFLHKGTVVGPFRLPTRRVLCYATAKLLRDEAESMVPNIDPEQVRKLAGWGLTQNDMASFVGCGQSLISLGF